MAMPNHITSALERVPTAKRDYLFHKTANFTVTVRQTGSVFTNLGASGAVTFSLPTNSSGEKGLKYTFVVMAAQTVNINAGSAGAFYWNGAKLSDDTDLSSSEIGESIQVESDGNGDWIITAVNGSWGTAILSGAVDLNGEKLTLDADADTSITADTDDQIDVEIAGADDFRFVANVFRALSGSSLETNTINETTAASGVTIDSVLLKDGGATFTGTVTGFKRIVEAHTGDDTLTAAETGSVHTSVGAAGTVVLTMPVAAVGLEFLFRVGAAQELRLDPNGTDTIALPSTGVQGAAGKYLTANADGESVYLVCDKANQWTCYGFTGTWTAEA